MLSRRSFLNSTLGAGLVLSTSHQAGAQTTAAQPGRERLIVDAQVHLWKAESDDWKWVPGMKPQMPEPFTIEKLVSWLFLRHGPVIATTMLLRLRVATPIASR